MKQRILIMGLPGSGKTYLAEALKKYLETHATSLQLKHQNNQKLFLVSLPYYIRRS